ncbi:acyl-CoA ligase (AMP-forming), exosortase A system-associated [Salana multivorans]
MGDTIHAVLEGRARAHPSRPAVTYKNDSLDYAALWSRVAGVGSHLAALGLDREDRVAIYLEKRLETVVAIFGASAGGGAFVPVNPLLRGRQVGHVVRDSGARVLVTSRDRLSAIASDLPALPDLARLILVDLPEGDDLAAAGVELPPALGHVTVHGWHEVCEEADESTGAAALPPSGIDTDIAAILYTSGSTGLPKGVVLSHRNLLVGAESVSSYLGNTSDDVILAVLPLSFDAGLSQVTTGFFVGAHVVLHNYLLPRDVPRACARYGVTGLTCVPPLWIQIADQAWPDEARQSLRYFANTGGRMPRTVLDRLREVFPGAAPYLMYGLTEAFRSTYLDPSQVDTRPDSIGKAIPNAEVLVLRPDGTRCAPGEHGELVHRGSLVALGYWNDPERTAERFRPVPGHDAPWRAAAEPAVWSGDTVVADEEGYLYFVGRADEMIKTSGYRVSPAEVEEAAYGTGLVRDAVALGLADPELGQRIVLVAAAAPGSLAGADPTGPDVVAALKPVLPTFMVPREVVLRPELPRSPNGKFDRTLLRSELES